MKKVVVTGAKGGTGRSIVKVFREAGYAVIGVDLKPCDVWESDYRQLDVEDGVQTRAGDSDGRTLYMTARTSLYRIRLKIQGVRP